MVNFLKTYIISSAQNNTPVHAEFKKCIDKMAKKISAEVVYIPFRYKNPTSLFTDKQEQDEHWEVPVISGELDLSRQCTVSHIKSIPTTKRPLSGISELCSGRRSFIVGSPVISHESVSRLEGEPAYLISTGCVTVANYTDSRSGRLGEFRHKLGAAVVDVRPDGQIHFRHIEFKDGCVCDISGTYYPNKPTAKANILGVVYGDLHSVSCDNAAFKTAKRISRALRPKQIIIHDALDFVELSHHKRGDFTHAFNGHLPLIDELNFLRGQLLSISKIAPASLVASNHDEHFDRWIKETDPRSLKSPDLIRLWCRLTDKLSTNMYINALHAYYEGLTNVDFWRRNENEVIGGYYVSQHGDIGASGTRGTAVGMSNMPLKTITGHTHSSYRHNDNIVVGSLTPYRMSYSKGFMKNDQGIAAIYRNGTATNINFVKGNYQVKI